MAEIIKESERIYRLNIWPLGRKWHDGIQVFANEDEELDSARNETLSATEKDGLADYLANPNAYETSLKLAYIEGATVRCTCGAAHQQGHKENRTRYHSRHRYARLCCPCHA
jgi:hypothetical protein